MIVIELRAKTKTDSPIVGVRLCVDEDEETTLGEKVITQKLREAILHVLEQMPGQLRLDSCSPGSLELKVNIDPHGAHEADWGKPSGRLGCFIATVPA